MVSVVALNATYMVAKEEWWSGDKDDSGDGKNSEDTVPDCTSLLEENPSQERGKDWITEGSMNSGKKGLMERNGDRHESM